MELLPATTTATSPLRYETKSPWTARLQSFYDCSIMEDVAGGRHVNVNELRRENRAVVTHHDVQTSLAGKRLEWRQTATDYWGGRAMEDRGRWGVPDYITPAELQAAVNKTMTLLNLSYTTAWTKAICLHPDVYVLLLHVALQYLYLTPAVDRCFAQRMTVQYRYFVPTPSAAVLQANEKLI